jgi:hypothetical protein
MAYYRERGWEVEDTHAGRPYDATATKNRRTLYLEAKGTTTPGTAVIVTRGEVAHAREHPGDCVLGVVSSISVDRDGRAVPGSGSLHVLEPWTPEDDDLRARQYDYRLPLAK